MLQALVVFLGGGLGAAARHGVNMATAQLSMQFPWSTLIINVTGSIIMGMLAAFFAFRASAPQELRLFLTTGVLGGYTTFSTFSLDAALLWERAAYLPFAGYVLASMALSIIGLFIGLWIVRALT